MGQFGRVTAIKFCEEKINGKSLGVCYIQFDEHLQARHAFQALSEPSCTIRGTPIRVRWSKIMDRPFGFFANSAAAPRGVVPVLSNQGGPVPPQPSPAGAPANASAQLMEVDSSGRNRNSNNHPASANEGGRPNWNAAGPVPPHMMFPGAEGGPRLPFPPHMMPPFPFRGDGRAPPFFDPAMGRMMGFPPNMPVAEVMRFMREREREQQERDRSPERGRHHRDKGRESDRDKSNSRGRKHAHAEEDHGGGHSSSSKSHRESSSTSRKRSRSRSSGAREERVRQHKDESSAGDHDHRSDEEGSRHSSSSSSRKERSGRSSSRHRSEGGHH